MEIALLVILFLIGTVGGAMQALKYLDRRRQDKQRQDRPRRDSSSGPS